MAKVKFFCEHRLSDTLTWVIQSDGHTVVEIAPEIGIADEAIPVGWPTSLPLIVLTTYLLPDWAYFQKDNIIYIPKQFREDFLLVLVRESIRLRQN